MNWRATLVSLAMLGCRREAALPVEAEPPEAEDQLVITQGSERTASDDARGALPAVAPELLDVAKEEPSPAALDPDPEAIVRWEDPDGAVHYAPRYRVPERYRPVARSVTTQVGRVTAEPARGPPLERGERNASGLDPTNGAAARLRATLAPPPEPPAEPTGPRLDGLTDAEREALAQAAEEARGATERAQKRGERRWRLAQEAYEKENGVRY